MEPSSSSLFMIDNKLANTQDTSSKSGDSKTSTNNDIGKCEHFDVTGTYSFLAASQKVWGIDLIWENITDYLSISDLKDLSLANKHFLEKVRNIPRFRSSAGQIVAGEMKIHTFNLCRAVVKVNTLDDKILQESAADIFQNTEYLELRNVDKPEETRNSRLIQIVANCPKLKSLVFQEIDYLCANWEPFFTNEKVKSVFSNLKELHLGIDKDYRFYRYHPYFHGSIVLNEVVLQQTLKYFPDLQMKLRKFCYMYEDTGCNGDKYYFFPELLLRSSEETLEELKIFVACKGFDALKIMQFPKLKKLHLKLYERSMRDKPPNGFYATSLTPYVADTLVPFLRNHLSTLCEFVLESINEYSLAPFCELFRSSKKIEVLRFSSRSTFGTSLRTTKWDFLATRSNFRDFKLCMDHAEVYYDLHYDAGSDSEEELEDINEENREMHFRRSDKSYYVPKYLDAFPSTIESIEFDHSIRNKLMKIPTAILISSLSRLENLTSLKVRNCKSFLNDDIVQFICQHVTKLRIFEGDFVEVTDFGISGVRGNGEPDSGISLANLKGLKKLTICASHHSGLRITWSGLHKAICFLELVELYVAEFHKYDDAAAKFPFELSLEEKEKIELNYLILINKFQNPSLEHVEINVRLPDTFDREQFPRVKTFSRHSPSSWYADMLNGPTIDSTN